MVEEKSTVATHSMVTPTCVDAPYKLYQALYSIGWQTNNI